MTETGEWHAIASDLADELEGVPFGARGAVIQSFRQGVLKPPTLRAFLAAHAWIRALRSVDADLAGRLERAPVAAIEVLRRWSAWDEEGARRAAAELVAGRHSVRSLRDAEGAARDERGRPRRAKDNWAGRLSAGDGVLRFACGVGGVLRAPAPGEGVLKVDLVAGEGNARVALLLVGPYSGSTLYTERAADWHLRALGLAAFFPRAGLVLDAKAPWEPFARWRKLAGGPAGDVLAVRQRAGGDFEELS